MCASARLTVPLPSKTHLALNISNQVRTALLGQMRRGDQVQDFFSRHVCSTVQQELGHVSCYPFAIDTLATMMVQYCFHGSNRLIKIELGST